MSCDVCWVSLDPVRRRIDFYPKLIAGRIEKTYGERGIYGITQCVLGSDFFNATIHISTGGYMCQKTPGFSMGRAGFKQPGYRSVTRLIVPENKRYTIFAKDIHGEQRICQYESDSEKTYSDIIPEECIIQSDNLSQADVELKAWRPEDLDSEVLDTNVVVWQWCRGTREKQGDLMKLSNEWWIPYLQTQNMEIENAFSKYENSVTIKINNNVDRTIRFNQGMTFATQNDFVNHKTRLIRRNIITIQELRESIDKIGTIPLDPSILASLIDTDSIPHEFFCCISQDVMSDPVKTIDGHTYDRSSIERWFGEHSTSPLTGLRLSSKGLVPNNNLRKIIEEFTLQKIAETKENTSVTPV
jgi:hypothetical protein